MRPRAGVVSPMTPDPTPEERQRAAELRRGAEPPFPAAPVDAAKACTLHGAAGCQACQILTLEGELSGLMACLDAVREALALPKGEPAPYGELAGHVEALRKDRDAARAVIAKAHALVYDDGPNRIGVYVQLCNLLDDAMPAPAGN